MGSGRRHLRLLLMIMIGTACRPEAALELTGAQIDFDDGLIDLNPRGRAQATRSSCGRHAIHTQSGHHASLAHAPQVHLPARQVALKFAPACNVSGFRCVYRRSIFQSLWPVTSATC